MVMLNSLRGNVNDDEGDDEDEDDDDALDGVTTLPLLTTIEDGSYDNHEYRRSYGNRRE
jgi:hypothetical protein